MSSSLPCSMNLLGTHQMKSPCYHLYFPELYFFPTVTMVSSPSPHTAFCLPCWFNIFLLPLSQMVPLNPPCFFKLKCSYAPNLFTECSLPILLKSGYPDLKHTFIVALSSDCSFSRILILSQNSSS